MLLLDVSRSLMFARHSILLLQSADVGPRSSAMPVIEAAVSHARTGLFLPFHMVASAPCGALVPLKSEWCGRLKEIPIGFRNHRLALWQFRCSHGAISGNIAHRGPQGAIMEMHQVRYFLAVARMLNFTRAADECNVTQPSLTRAIKQLEAELGGDLFRRERPQPS